MRVLREGSLGAVLLLAVAALIGRLVGWVWALPWILLAGGVLYFFRDPDRVSPSDPDLVLAAADGKITTVEWLPPDSGFQVRISTVLGLRNVHIIRSPVDGRVAGVTRWRGRFIDAEHPNAYRVNTRNRIGIDDGAAAVEVVQIAGLIARRIVCWVGVGDTVRRGQRIGLIRFGSRTDVYLPPGMIVLVEEGAHVRAGVDPIARVQPRSAGMGEAFISLAAGSRPDSMSQPSVG